MTADLDTEAIRKIAREAAMEAFHGVGKRTVDMWFVDLRRRPAGREAEWVTVEGPLATEEHGWLWVEEKGHCGTREYAKDHYRVRQVALALGW